MHPTALNVEMLRLLLSALQSIPLHYFAAYQSVTPIAADILANSYPTQTPVLLSGPA